MDPVWISLGGALGAVCRYGVGHVFRGQSFPWATLIVNAVGSFILGIVIASVTGSQLLLFTSVGFCGAFTTYSSFSFQTIELWERGDKRLAVANAAGNLVVSLLAFVAALRLLG